MNFFRIFLHFSKIGSSQKFYILKKFKNKNFRMQKKLVIAIQILSDTKKKKIKINHIKNVKNIHSA